MLYRDVIPRLVKFKLFVNLQKKKEADDIAQAAEAARDDDVEDELEHIPRFVAPVVEKLVGDEFTRKSFGADAVVVTTRFGLGNDDADIDEDEDVDAFGDPSDAALAELAASAPKQRGSRATQGFKDKTRGGHLHSKNRGRGRRQPGGDRNARDKGKSTKHRGSRDA